MYIGLDRYGLDYLLPTKARNAVVLELLRRGYVERMFLSQDFSAPIAAGVDWFPPEAMEQSRASGATRDWSMTFLFDTVIPQLRQGGMSEVDLRTMMQDNPSRWLGGA